MITFAIEQVPFSTYGSRLSLSPVAKSHAALPSSIQTLYLRSHYDARPGTIHAFLQLQPLNSKTLVRTTALTTLANPTSVTWSDAEGNYIEFCFETPRCLRLRGKGLGLELKALYDTVLFAEHDNQLSLNIFDISRRYVLENLQGKLETIGVWRANVKEDVRLTILPDDTGVWELALHEVKTTTFVAESHQNFATCLSAAKAAFEEWLSKTLPVTSAWQETRELAAYINWASVVEPYGLLKRPAMLMSKGWMSSVWSWDHCFNALALIEGKSELSWDQLLLIADYQDEHGCYPDSVNDVEVIYNFTKPPIHGWTVREMLNISTPSREVLETLYISLSRLTKWWLNYRRLPEQALPYYLHGNDSGWDNGTMFDAGVPLVAPDLAAFLVLQMDTLADLAKELSTNEENYWKNEADVLLASLISELWTGERFVAKLARTQETVANDSLLYCLPILLGKRLPETIQEALCKTVMTFLTPHGLATELPSSPNYQSDGYWRGPIWAPSTHLVVRGLEACGYHELARDISVRFCDMCKQYGFAENFDALTGQGLRDVAYTWTSSVFLLLAHQLYKAET
ncbi:MAG: amylo-alpha-1,6-glucosidase, partial [Trueperaceae bacterium]